MRMGNVEAQAIAARFEIERWLSVGIRGKTQLIWGHIQVASQYSPEQPSSRDVTLMIFPKVKPPSSFPLYGGQSSLKTIQVRRR